MRARGFTLVEVLAALAVTALATVALSQGLGTASTASARAAAEDGALRAAENALAAVVGGAKPPVPAPGEAAPIVRVVRRADLVVAGAPASVTPYEVAVSVAWRAAGGGERRVVLSTLVLGGAR